ncbi:hypothetical protein [Campylobacter sp. LR264d]|uniref:hypothetical protein n=1 Tax=Campylobacter sp. LR264d TaxID=2593544 RepID=UPI0016807E5A|nr:hypothetical protein [Campylobacter sp. LR264d]
MPLKFINDFKDKIYIKPYFYSTCHQGIRSSMIEMGGAQVSRGLDIGAGNPL